MSTNHELHKKKKYSVHPNIKEPDQLNDCDVPREIDTHYQLYGKHVWETDKSVTCNICNGGVDENGLCACGSGEN